MRKEAERRREKELEAAVVSVYSGEMKNKAISFHFSPTLDAKWTSFLSKSPANAAQIRQNWAAEK